MRQRRERQMNRNQLEQQRESVEAQMRWAVLHSGDRELLDLLRFESARLFDRAMSLPIDRHVPMSHVPANSA
jgi:hypothetical protein